MATNFRSIKDHQLPIFTRYYAHLAECTSVKQSSLLHWGFRIYQRHHVRKTVIHWLNTSLTPHVASNSKKRKPQENIHIHCPHRSYIAQKSKYPPNFNCENIFKLSDALIISFPPNFLCKPCDLFHYTAPCSIPSPSQELQTTSSLLLSPAQHLMWCGKLQQNSACMWGKIKFRTQNEKWNKAMYNFTYVFFCTPCTMEIKNGLVLMWKIYLKCAIYILH
jgi:hypothetical protein